MIAVGIATDKEHGRAKSLSGGGEMDKSNHKVRDIQRYAVLATRRRVLSRACYCVIV